MLGQRRGLGAVAGDLCEFPADGAGMIEPDALSLLSDKDSMTGRIEDAGLDPDTLPGCTLKNWQALQSVLDDIVPETNGEA